MPTAFEMDNARKVHDVLVGVVGRDNRIDSWELSRLSGVYRPYISVAARIAGMEVAAPGVVLGSCVGPGGGYYRAETPEEVDEIMLSRELHAHSRLERDCDTAERACRGLRGSARTHAVNRREALKTARFQVRSSLAEYGVLIGEFAPAEEETV